jgi:3-isopropylmalate dehydrogenase
MRLRILVLPGDGIGPEVVAQAVRVLQGVGRRFRHAIECADAPIGAAAIQLTGSPLPEGTKRLALDADAVLLGAVGLPEFDGRPPDQRPERGLLELRRLLGVYANLRPVRALPGLLHASPLKAEIVSGTDLIVVRELTAGLYYGQPRGISGEGLETRAVNTMTYSRAEIERIARLAFDLARTRRRHVTSVDKSNVLENSRLWRQVVVDVAAEYPDVTLTHLFVDNCAMQLVIGPKKFDVLLTENMFGDILSDEAAVLAGSIGLLPSASIGERRGNGLRGGLYEPIHGSAPDIAGRGIANPIGTIRSVAAMFDYGFGLKDEAKAIEDAVDAAIAGGVVTADLSPGGRAATTADVGDAVCATLEASSTGSAARSASASSV